jgi:prephenate dehydrogenase
VRIAVVGVGLIGGSIALAARDRLDADVRESDPALDGLGGMSIPQALDGAEAAFVAAPLGVLGDVIDDVLAAAPADCVVSDVGSVKAPLLRDDERFCGGHPLAGSEQRGRDHARADLFEGATWYLTPTSRTGGILLERLHRVIAGLGARPRSIDADEHDRMLAAVSHLPHVLANVLVKEAAGAIGPSFRDATRVAGANPPLWRDIYLANRAELSRAIGAVRAELAAVDRALLEGDGEWLEDWQGFAADRRRELLETETVGGALAEVRMAVPNRPGVVAELALALGRAGINIHDMSLSPSADNTRGEIAFWVPEAEAARAAEVVGA